MMHITEPNSEESILDNIKDALDLPVDENAFDGELKIHINSAIGILNQNGVCKSMTVIDGSETWGDLREPSDADYVFNMAKTYIYLKTKQLFDPPPPNTAGYNESAVNELIWRIREG